MFYKHGMETFPRRNKKKMWCVPSRTRNAKRLDQKSKEVGHGTKISCSSQNGRRIKQKYDVLQPYFSYCPDSNPIIFLHGMCDTRKTWRVVAPIIVNKTGRKAYLIDARNHGESSSSKESDFDVLTQDVVDFMDDNGIRRAVVVGHSMGGRTAINFALKHPERTEALVVEDMTPRNLKTGPNTFFRTLYDLMVDNIRRIPADADLSTVKRNVLNFLFEFGKEVYSHSGGIPKHIRLDSETSCKSPSPENCYNNESSNGIKRFQLFDLDSIALVKVDGKISPEFDQDAVESMMEKNFLVQDLPKKKDTFEGRAPFLYGDSSFFNLEEDYSVRKLFPKATTKKIPNAMHLIHLQHPEEFAEAVSRFILLKDTDMSKY